MTTDTWTRYPIGAARVAAEDARDRADDRAAAARVLASLDGPTVYDAVVADYGFDPMAR